MIARIALLTCLLAVAAAAMGPAAPAPRITIMTWNIYYGGGADGGVPDMSDLFESVQATGFHQRATRIARIVAQNKPHIICLQEVARWRSEDFLGEEDDDIDFLAILQARLLSRGLNYQIVGALDTIDFEAPGEIDGSFRMIRWQERIVMLARHSSQLVINNVRLRRFNSTYSLPIPVVGPLEFERGWIAADITFRGRKARYVCTHLEAFDATVRRQQAQHLINWLSHTSLPVVVMGDLNALPLSNEYSRFINAGYADAWTANHGLFSGPTCCQSGDLMNGSSELTHRIDHVMTRGALSVDAAARVGHRQADRTPSGLWPSDHAGLVARLRLN